MSFFLPSRRSISYFEYSRPGLSLQAPYPLPPLSLSIPSPAWCRPRMAQHSDIARSAIMTCMSSSSSSSSEFPSSPSSSRDYALIKNNGVLNNTRSGVENHNDVNGVNGNNGNSNNDNVNNNTAGRDTTLMPPPKTVIGRALGSNGHSEVHKAPSTTNGVGKALTDTPISTAPPSPQMYVIDPLPRICLFSAFPALFLGLDRAPNLPSGGYYFFLFFFFAFICF